MLKTFEFQRWAYRHHPKSFLFFRQRKTGIVENSARPQGAKQRFGFGGEIDLAIAHGMAVMAADKITLFLQLSDVPLDLPGIDVQQPGEVLIPLEAVALAMKPSAEIPQQVYVSKVHAVLQQSGEQLVGNADIKVQDRCRFHRLAPFTAGGNECAGGKKSPFTHSPESLFFCTNQYKFPKNKFEKLDSAFQKLKQENPNLFVTAKIFTKISGNSGRNFV